jgi:transcriptional regulator with PAS, ATPase and Fis domain
MEPSDPQVLETAPEELGDEARRAEPILVHIGSAEDGFSSAGRTVSLTGVHRVRFGRAEEPGEVAWALERGVLRVAVPAVWASGTHADLTLHPLGSPTEQDLHDLGSRNGTIVEGRAITGVTTLGVGEVFEIGRTFWMVQRAASPVPDATDLVDFDPTGTASPTMRQVERSLARLARGDVPILLVGETGTGKEYLARRIHDASGRGGGLVKTSLAGAPPSRVEHALFGADGQPGAIERARGGTLFIDDISGLPPDTQAKLLWALTEHPRLRTEGDAAVRIVAGSLRDVAAMVAAHRFRADLYSRVAGFEARLPALRERREDLGVLCAAFLREMGDLKLETPAFRRLFGHAWPFNVRELAQTLAAAASVGSDATTITRAALDDVLRPDDEVPDSADAIRVMRQELVRQLVAADGDTAAVAASFGVEPEQIERWLARFDIEPGQYRGLS